MKIKNHLLLFGVSILLLCSFSMDVGYYGGYGSTPKLMLRSDFEQAIKTLSVKELDKTSRINIKGNMIYIVELYRGVHVIDNADPSQPKTIHFINIPGCVDMSIKGNQLFARSAEDLVAIDISDISDVKEISRLRETFPEIENGDEYYSLPYRFSKGQRPANTVIVAWEKK